MEQEATIDWENDAIASYIATFETDNEEGACDVFVYVGEGDDGWYVKTEDDDGNSDSFDIVYPTRKEAVKAAKDLALELDESDCFNGTAEEFIDHRRAKLATEGKDRNGEWCVYWTTALDDSGPCDRYSTREAAEAGAVLADKKLRQYHPGHLLCGYEVRCLVDSKWIKP
jgi:hypothetical protein